MRCEIFNLQGAKHRDKAALLGYIVLAIPLENKAGGIQVQNAPPLEVTSKAAKTRCFECKEAITG